MYVDQALPPTMAVSTAVLVCRSLPFPRLISMVELVPSILPAVEASVAEELKLVQDVGKIASRSPYYRWNNVWSRAVQDTVCLFVRKPARGACSGIVLFPG